MFLQNKSRREPSVGKLWNLLGRLHEIHVAAKRAICRQSVELTWSPPRDPYCCNKKNQKRAICRQIMELTWSPSRDPCCCKDAKECHLLPNYGTYLVASKRSMLLQREPPVDKYWNLLGRLHEIHVAAREASEGKCGTYLVASTKSMFLQIKPKREPSRSVDKL
jgi:hypothetical protein